MRTDLEIRHLARAHGVSLRTTRQTSFVVLAACLMISSACEGDPPPAPVVVSDAAPSNSGEVRLCPVCKRRFFGGQKFCTVDGTMLTAIDSGGTSAAPPDSAQAEASPSPAPTSAPDPLLAKVENIPPPVAKSDPPTGPTASVVASPRVDPPAQPATKWKDPLDAPPPPPARSTPPSNTNTTAVASAPTTSSTRNNPSTSSPGTSSAPVNPPPSTATSSTAKTTPQTAPVATAPSNTKAGTQPSTNPSTTQVAMVPPATTNTKTPTTPNTPSAGSVSVDELFKDPSSLSAAAQAGKLTPAQVGALASVDKSAEQRYTDSRSYLTMYYKATGNEAEYEKSLKELLALPSNQYNPSIKLEEAEYLLKKRRYQEAIAAASVAERYRQKFPTGDVYYLKVARTYEVMAKAYEGKFAVSEDPEDLDNAIRMWNRFLTHVRTRADAKMTKMAEENISKLQKIKEKVL